MGMVVAFVAGAIAAEVIDVLGLILAYGRDAPLGIAIPLYTGVIWAPLVGGLIAVVWASSVRQPPAD
jgi:hypothetical protein